MERPHANLSVLSALTMSQIIAALPRDTFSHTETRCRLNLEKAILFLPEHFIQIIVDLATCPELRNSKESSSESMRSMAVEDITTSVPAQFCWRSSCCAK